MLPSWRWRSLCTACLLYTSIPVTRVDIPAQLKGALFLVSDEHGVVPATEADAAEADAATVAFFADGYEKLRARR